MRAVDCAYYISDAGAALERLSITVHTSFCRWEFNEMRSKLRVDGAREKTDRSQDARLFREKTWAH